MHKPAPASLMRRKPSKQFRSHLPIFFIVVASCLRVFACFQHNPLDYLWSDSLRLWTDGTHFPRAGYYGAADPILYQLYLSVLQHLTHNNRYFIALAAALMSVLMPWTYYRAARTFGRSKTPALWVWALIACTPSLLTIYHFFMMETLLLLMEGFALWATARYLRQGGTSPFLLMIVTWTLASLTKPTVGPIAAVCVIWACWKKHPAIRVVAAGAALAVTLLIPSAIRTEFGLGFIAPFGNPWFIKIQHRSGAKYIHVKFYSKSSELFHKQRYVSDVWANSPSCDIRPLWPLSDWALRRALAPSTVTVSVDADHGARDWKSAYEGLNVGVGEWLAQWRENIIFFFFAPSYPESVVPQWDGRLEFYGRWLWAPLIIIVLSCNVRRFLRRQWDLIPVVVTLFTLFLLLQNVVTFEGRYRKPLEPLLLLNLVWIVAAPSDKPREKAGAFQDDHKSAGTSG